MCTLLSLVVVSAANLPNAAASPITVAVLTSTGSCPDAATLAAALEAPLRRHRVQIGHTEDAIPISVLDQGESYLIHIGQVVKRYQDPNRRCGERAQAAAVLLTLILEPARNAPKPPPPPPPVVKARTAPQASARVRLSLEGEGIFEGNTAQDLSGGGTLRFLLAPHRMWAVGVSLGARSPSPARDAPLALAYLRIPADLFVQLRLPFGGWAFAAEVGALLLGTVAWQEQARASALSPGLTASLGMHRDLGTRLSLYGAVRLGYTPRPPQILLEEPMSVSLPLPAIWVGGALGLALRLW